MWKCLESSWWWVVVVVVGNINNHYHSSLSWVELSRIELRLRVDQYDVFCKPVLVWLLSSYPNLSLLQQLLWCYSCSQNLKTYIHNRQYFPSQKYTLCLLFPLSSLSFTSPPPPTPPLAPISLFVLPIWVYCFGFGIRVGCTYRLRVDNTVPISNLLIMVWRPSFLFHWDRVGSFISTPHFFDRGVYKHTWTNILLPSLFTLATYITY